MREYDIKRKAIFWNMLVNLFDVTKHGVYLLSI